METTVVIALITALAAIISPMITAMMNNRSAIRLKKIETNGERLKNIDLHEREVLEKALAGLGSMIGYYDKESAKESCKTLLTALAYVDVDTGDKILQVVQSFPRTSSGISPDYYSIISKSIKSEIDKRTRQLK